MTLIESISGIRGIYGKDLTEGNAIRYVHAYCSFLRKKTQKKNPTVVIGMDTRPSSLKLSDAILRLIGCNFIDVGIASTPAVELAVRYFNADGGIIITASHNEPYWNGFKFLAHDGSVLDETCLNWVTSNAKTLKNFHKIQDRKIFEKNYETIDAYTDFILKIIGNESLEKIKSSNQKIILDPNGGAGAISKRILEKCGVEAIGVNMTYGEFNRAVDPTEDSLIYLKNNIDEKNADFAAAFDCDADRLEIMLKNGQLLSGNYLLAIIVNFLLTLCTNPRNQKVVVSDATSNVVRDTVKKFGARLIEVEVGEANVIKMMDKLNALVGGEGSSGGVIIPPSKCRDGILTLLMILSIVATKQKKLEDFIIEFPRYYTLRKKIDFDKSKHDNIKKYLKNYYSKKGFEIKETGGIKGGLKVITDKNSFIWFRASKTEGNYFRIISDSNKKDEAEKLMEEAVNIFNKANQ